MRIISGTLKGKKLFLPLDKKTRPLKDLTKESIFNLIEHSNKLKINISKSKILDAFSGSGSIGFECISRGAVKVTFIENYKPAIKILEKNIKKFKIKNKCEIYNCDFLNFNVINQYDIIFLDPPFAFKELSKIFDLIKLKNYLKREGIIILHRHKSEREMLPSYIKETEVRTYGISKIFFLELN